MKNKEILTNYKVLELKSIAKKNQLYVSGKKSVLLDRIETFFIQSFYAVQIQKVFRSFLTKKCFLLKGPAFRKDVSICVNESDFYTLEPLNEISFDSFYSFRDSKDFIYGFNIFSIIQYFIKKGTFVNPYNREKMNTETILNIFSLYYKTLIVFPDSFEDSMFDTNDQCFIRTYYRNIYHRIIIQRRRQKKNGNAELNAYETTILENQIIESDTNEENQIQNQNQQQIFNRLREIRSKSVINRIQELFMEIDFLGNYTQSDWFTTLTKNNYIFFLRYLKQYWNYRARLSIFIKQKVYILGDPFLNINTNFTEEEISIDQYRENCLYVMENMIFGGETDEYRKLGALYVLSALTVVSIPARNSMIWLYEGLPY